MRNTNRWRRGALSMTLLAAVAASQPANAGADKVTVCHIPPGNPENAHTIVVGPTAVPAHLAHGDTLGECGSGGGEGGEGGGQ